MSLIPTVNVLVGSNLPSQRLFDIAFALGPSSDDCWLDFALITGFKGYPPESIPPTRPWTDQNKAYTIRLCQGLGRRDLLTDEVLHSKLLEYAQEEQVMNMITMSAPPADPVPIRTLRVIHSISPIHKTRGSASSSASGPTALSAASNATSAAQVLELWLPRSKVLSPASPFRRSSVLNSSSFQRNDVENFSQYRFSSITSLRFP